MKLRARNVLSGERIEIVTASVTAHVWQDVGGNLVTPSINNEAVREMDLALGNPAYAVVKTTDVMIGID